MIESIRQVLVHLDATGAIPHRPGAAREIAQECGAAVSALYAVMPSFIGLPYGGDVGPTVVAVMKEIDDEHRARAHRAWEEACRTSGPIPSWSEADEVLVIGAFVQQALYADLLVLGQHDPSDSSAAALPSGFAESVVVASGKPALIIPYTGCAGLVGGTVAIAWKETRESARAVAASLPLLQRSRRVHVLSWGEPGGARCEGSSPGPKRLPQAARCRSHMASRGQRAGRDRRAAAVARVRP